MELFQTTGLGRFCTVRNADPKSGKQRQLISEVDPITFILNFQEEKIPAELIKFKDSAKLIERKEGGKLYSFRFKICWGCKWFRSRNDGSHYEVSKPTNAGLDDLYCVATIQWKHTRPRIGATEKSWGLDVVSISYMVWEYNRNRNY